MSSAKEAKGDDPWQCKGAAGAGVYIIQQGECIESVAAAQGLHWETVWNHPKNAELKAARKDPFVLLPGDRLHVPEKTLRNVSCATDQSHRFRVHREASRFRVIVKEKDAPRGNERYTLDVDGQVLTGQTAANGLIDHVVPLGARRVRLTLCEDETFTFQLGGLDPIDSPTGVQHRLRNLGLYDGAIDGVAGPMTRSALRKFQEMLDLRASGEPDTGTLDSLKNEHGS